MISEAGGRLPAALVLVHVHRAAGFPPQVATFALAHGHAAAVWRAAAAPDPELDLDAFVTTEDLSLIHI